MPRRSITAAAFLPLAIVQNALSLDRSPAADGEKADLHRNRLSNASERKISVVGVLHARGFIT